MSAAAHPACDVAGARTRTATSPPAHPALVLATTILASSLAFVDGSVVNVGLPAIGRSLGASAGDLPWVVNGYLIPLGALLLLGGAAGDRYGRRRVLIVGVAVFAAASLGCAVAPGLPALVACRGVQGLGAALLMPNSLAILGATFSGERKGRAIGIWAASGAAMGALGPVLGGWLVDLGSWRAIFLLNLPLALGAIALAWRFVPADARTPGRRLDWTGGALATAALSLLTWALTVASGGRGWTAATLGAAVGALGLSAAFVVVEHRLRDRAMTPLAMFGSKGFVGLSLLTLLLYGALGGMFVLIPYLLIVSAGYSATAAGAALLPLPLVLTAASPVMGALAGRIGPRIPLAIGPLVVAGGFALMTRIGAKADYATEVLPAILVVALGMSGAVAPLTTAVLGSVDAQHTGSASGLNSALARIGGLVATALVGGVLVARGPAVVAAFHAAALAGAAVCLAASAAAFLLIGRDVAEGDAASSG